MTIDKAIEILEDLDTTLPQFDPELRREAVKLGIRALKDQLKAREAGWLPPGYKLPGEAVN